MKALFSALVLALLLVTAAQAAIDTYTFKSETQREQFRQLTAELRCPKCQNQNIADSNAPIATDLRREIFRMLEEGKDNQQITEYLVARYGDFVRYKPELNSRTWLLWYGPGALLLAGLLVLGLIVRRKRPSARDTASPLSRQEQARLDALLNNEPQDKQD